MTLWIISFSIALVLRTSRLVSRSPRLLEMVHLEALGLGLGIAPLIAELLKANPEPVNAFKALDPKYITESRQEFYRDLAFEVTMLKMTLTSLVRELPITDEEKSKLVDDKNLDVMVWKKPSEELRSALEGRLSSCSDTFIQSMERILQLFGRIVEDKSVPLSANQIVGNASPVALFGADER